MVALQHGGNCCFTACYWLGCCEEEDDFRRFLIFHLYKLVLIP